MVVVSSRSTNFRRLCRCDAKSMFDARFLETRTVMILHDHIDDGGHLVALKSRAAELADSLFERVRILRHERGDLLQRPHR